MPAVDPPQVARALYDSLVQTLAANGAESQLNEVIDAFFDQARGSGPRDAEVTSAVQLAQQQQDAILQQLRTKYGPGIDTKFTVDQQILGGLIIRVGDKVIDDSVRSRLAQVQQRMLG